MRENMRQLTHAIVADKSLTSQKKVTYTPLLHASAEANK